MALSTRMVFTLAADLTSALDLATASVPLAISKTIEMATGTSTGLADKVFHDTRTLTASATEDLDLAGSLTDALGTALTIVKLKAVYISAASANTNNVVLSRPAANGVPLFSAASDAISVLPGGMLLWVAPGAGVTVTAATGDLMTITNSAGSTSVTYDVVLIGTSA